MRLGILYDEPFPDYLTADAVSAHKLADVEPRPLIYKLKYVDRILSSALDTEALSFGRYFHCLAAEGEGPANERFLILPPDAPAYPSERSWKAKESSGDIEKAKKWWLAKKEEAGKRELVSSTDHLRAWTMVEAVRKHKEAAHLFDEGRPEVTLRKQMSAMAVQCRPDWLVEKPKDGGPPGYIDIKTVENLEIFDQQFESLRYYQSAALNRLLIGEFFDIPARQVQMRFLVCEKQAPFECEVRVPDEESLAIGAVLVMRKLGTLKRCFETGHWPGASESAKGVSVSQRLIRKFEHNEQIL
jgi:hypothetical protein